VTPSGCMGVAALAFHAGRIPDFHQRNLLDAFASQIALVLDRQRLRDSDRRAQLVAESERLGKALLNSVSHELRTPLAAITGAVAELRDAIERPESRGPLLAEIDEAVTRLNRLVRNLLDVTRIESGHLQPRPDWCDVSDLVRAAVQESTLALRTHRLSIDAPAGLPLVHVDAVLLVHALHNLLVNAATHTPAGTAVELSAVVHGRTLLLAVADRGPGIPEADLPRLFERFFRGATARPGGTGLGLAIARGFTEANGGTVNAENRPGGGAVFTIRLPLQDPPTLPVEAGE
jgi:two-component system, OmpR family, sensor histidine kinase KdpD